MAEPGVTQWSNEGHAPEGADREVQHTGEQLGRSVRTRTQGTSQLPTTDSLPQMTCPTLTPTKLTQAPLDSCSTTICANVLRLSRW